MTEQVAPAKATLSDSLSGMMNAFVDPGATAAQAVKRGFWILPLIVLCAIVLTMSLSNAPIAIRVLEMNPPSNLTHEQFEKALPVIRGATYGLSAATPLIVVALCLLSAWLTGILCSTMGVKATFKGLFSLIVACSMITALQSIAGFIAVRMKGDDIQSVQELQPPFGLDLLFPGLKGVPFAVLNFFSIFEIWFIVMLGLSLAAMARTTKGKAFAAITPAWLVPLLLRMLGALAQPSQ
jgi:hypothetical protein